MKVYFDSGKQYQYTVNKISRPGRHGRTIKGELDKEFYKKFKKIEKQYRKMESKIASLFFKFERMARRERITATEVVMMDKEKNLKS